MMTKKLVTLVTVVSLVFTVGIATMAKDMTAYIEYEDQEDVDNFGPTVGLDWKVNDKWTASASYQLEGDGPNEATLSVGAGYAINENLSAGLSYDTADHEDSTCLELNGRYALEEPLTLIGGIAYTDYSEDLIADYHKMELSAGAQYQVSEDLTTGLKYVRSDPSEGDTDNYFEFNVAYAMNEYGVYCKYETPDDGDKITIGASYSF
ncbi:MAG: porin, partial [Bacillota bacterium]|jgi:long-subunit fatty acid transport protein